MDSIESLDVKLCNFYESPCRSKQYQELLFHAIENIDLKSGRKLILDKGISLSNIEPKFLTRFLWHAVKIGDSVLVDELLNYKPELSTPEGYEDSLLWLAVKKCYIAIARSLITAGADLNEKLLSDPNKPSFLHAVIMWWQKSKDTEIAIHMIDFGADVNACDANGNSVLHTAMLYDADLVLVAKLLENGAQIDAVNNEGYDLLLTAACNANAEIILPIIVGYNVDEDTMRQRGIIALQYLIMNSDQQKLDAVRKLLKMNLPINALDNSGVALIHWAVSVDRIEVVTMLLDFGAEVNVKSKEGTLPLFEASKLPKSSITRLLIERGADIELCHDDGRHPIHAACAEASLQNIHLYLQLGVNLNAVDKDGCTPFQYLPLKNANLACIKLVLKHLALLQTKGVKIHERNLTIIENISSIKSYYHDCLSELQKMKDSKVYNNIPFFCCFSKTAVELSKLIRNQDFVKDYESRYESLFPLYVMQIKYAFAIAEMAKNILECKENSLNEIFQGIISDLAVEKTTGYVCHERLKNLHRVFYFSLHESINQKEPDYGNHMLR